MYVIVIRTCVRTQIPQTSLHSIVFFVCIEQRMVGSRHILIIILQFQTHLVSLTAARTSVNFQQFQQKVGLFRINSAPFKRKPFLVLFRHLWFFSDEVTSEPIN